MTNIAIIGSRTFTDYDKVKEYIDKLIHDQQLSEITIVSGGAKGSDKCGEMYAIDNNYQMQIFKPNWKVHGRGAGFIRNTQIIEASDIVVAFWDHASKGTLNSINTAKKLNKQLIIINTNEIS